MALTSEQESILEQIIDAYENGKRISDLPELTDANPFDLYTEVVYEGESRKGRLADMLPYVEGDVAYGVRWNKDDSAPACTRIGNMDLHKTLPVQSLMRGCLLDDDGNVVEYLPDSDWTGATLDGSKGQVMVELPAHYRKFATYDDGTIEVWLSLYPVAGYQYVPKIYVSAYEATVQRSTLKLSSVQNTDTDYRGGNNSSSRDGTEASQLGVPAGSISAANFLTYARNRGERWSSGLYMAQKTIYWFFVVEYATRNSQATFNDELTSEGYHQGGLGIGVTAGTYANWTSFNSNGPFIPCGYTDSFGNRTGIVTFTMPESWGAEKTFDVPRYRGIENPFGHIYKNLCDILVVAHAATTSGGDGRNYVYTCKDPLKFNFNSIDDYTLIGTTDGSDSGSLTMYFKNIIGGIEAEVIGIDSGGSSSTYYCDSFGVNNSVEEDTMRPVRGGHCTSDSGRPGLASATSADALSAAYPYHGSRLCFIPA